MKKLDPTVLKETKYILAFTLVCSMLMQAVFLIIGKWDFTVLLGNLLGAAAAVGNFLLMGITVQTALGREEKEAKNVIKLSQMLRMLMLFAVAVVGYLVPVFDLIALILTYIFPRIAVALHHIFIKE